MLYLLMEPRESFFFIENRSMSVDEVAECGERHKSDECCGRQRSCCSPHHDVLYLKAPAVSAVHQVIIDNIRCANRTVK
jgi:hypothetical protein